MKMAKNKKKDIKDKKKVNIRWKRVVAFFVSILIIVLLVFYLCNQKITNIIVKGNNYLTKQQILDICGLDNYPIVANIGKGSMTRKLKAQEVVQDAKIRLVFLKLHIEVDEYHILFYNSNNKKLIVGTGKEIVIDQIPSYAPILINYVPDEVYSELIKKMNLIDISILKKISDIEYSPNEVDEERFLLRMNDSNTIYVTLTKMKELNKYNEVLQQIEGKKGILYLDAGNYFTIKG